MVQRFTGRDNFFSLPLAVFFVVRGLTRISAHQLVGKDCTFEPPRWPSRILWLRPGKNAPHEKRQPAVSRGMAWELIVLVIDHVGATLKNGTPTEDSRRKIGRASCRERVKVRVV